MTTQWHRIAFMLYAYWYVKLRSIGLKTQKMSLTNIKLIGDVNIR